MLNPFHLKLKDKNRESVKKAFKNVIKKRTTVAILLAVGLFVMIVWILSRPPDSFPVHKIVTIKEGKSLTQVSQFLKENNVIRSELLFEAGVILRGSERSIMAGDYFFVQPHSVFAIAERFAGGVFGITPIRITIPEGATIFETVDIFVRSMPDFNKDEFILLGKQKEGYLFPDTYLFYPTISPERVINIMEKNFERKINPYLSEVEKFGKTLEDVVIMASIIEREVKVPEDRNIVSGILWKRIGIGMPLQVDAAFIYVNGKTTFGLSLADLKIDNPYNTYLYKGLPKGPIGNPGLEALLAAINPTITPYLYYMSDNNGNTHYSETFEQHKRNKEKYLW